MTVTTAQQMREAPELAQAAEAFAVGFSDPSEAAADVVSDHVHNGIPFI